ncbi:radical SAM protein [Carboxylicivirga caseinilyticus]|uniref:SPL family radical SAM protein n=1 Tax=Carboxylicivirga caseinilyticus TaxID=3417572 RepID=UPI003D33642A|nr:radical SAM protein [Marinilabiliaceae bacterium A049]
MTEIIKAKTILGTVKQPDHWFGNSYNLNLYRGCSHGCIYCDSRSTCYQIQDFDTIQIKGNALELLHKELRSKKKRGTISFGSMNDCYMPIEAKQQLTRKALQIVAHHKFPVHIITKGTLVTRDIDLLKEIGKVYSAVSITITTADDDLAKQIEPNAPTSSERFAALNQLRKEGIYAGITLMPILPFINDTEENIRQLVELAAENNAAYIIASMGMTIREGQREYFYKKLDKEFPGIKEKYTSTFGDNYGCGSPNGKRLQEIFKSTCFKYGISTKMKFYQPELNSQMTLF